MAEDICEELDMKTLCEELDNALLDVMGCLKRLAHARNQYSAVAKEVGIIWSDRLLW